LGGGGIRKRAMQRSICIFAILLLLLGYSDARSVDVPFQKDHAMDPEEQLLAPDIIRYWGYPAESYEAQTADGYVLTLHRIPYGKASPQTNTSRPVILMMHGLEESSTCWIINLPQQSAGSMYADAGYDVWLGNVRGNTYSKKHVRLDPKQKEFWRFSWDEMVKYDLDAIFDKIEEVTGKRKIYYMGHSQGTLIMFGKLASDPDFSERTERVFALAPVARVKNIKGLLKYLADYVYPYFPQIFDLLGDREFLPSNWLMKLISEFVCDNLIGEVICDNIIFLIAGPEIEGLNKTRTAVYTAHAPAGTSTENIIHWTQMIISGKMQMYDFRDVRKNQQHYGQTIPPVYDLTKVRGKLHLFSSKEDYLADSNDVDEFLIPNLNPNVVQEHVVFDEYSHLDFVWSPTIYNDVYQVILNSIRKLDGVP